MAEDDADIETGLVLPNTDTTERQVSLVCCKECLKTAILSLRIDVADPALVIDPSFDKKYVWF